MRFKKYENIPFTDTPRKRSAALRRNEKTVQKYPLFEEELRENFLDIDDEMVRRRDQYNDYVVKDRQTKAYDWKKARALLATYPEEARKKPLRYWNLSKFPATGSYLYTLLLWYETDKVDLDEKIELLEKIALFQ